MLHGNTTVHVGPYKQQTSYCVIQGRLDTFCSVHSAVMCDALTRCALLHEPGCMLRASVHMGCHLSTWSNGSKRVIALAVGT